MICPECKQENTEAAKACRHCGTILPEPGRAVVTEATEDSAVIPVTPPPVIVSPPKPDPPKADPPPIKREIAPTRRRWLVPALTGLGSALVSGFSGYGFGERGQTELANELRELRERAQKLELDLRNQGAAHDSRDKLAAAQAQNTALRQQQSKLQQALKKAQADEGGLRQQLESERRRPKFGVLEWSGNIRNNSQEILIQDGHVSAGSLRGALPGTACTVLAGEPARVSVTEPPNEPNWNRVGFRITGKGQTTVRLFWGLS